MEGRSESENDCFVGASGCTEVGAVLREVEVHCCWLLCMIVVYFALFITTELRCLSYDIGLTVSWRFW